MISSLMYAIFLPICLNSVLFSGEWVQFFMTKTRDFSEFWESSFYDLSGIMQLKQYIVAPILEEIVYRGIILNLCTFGDTAAVLFTPIYFSASHLHHLLKARNKEKEEFRREIFVRLFQFSFTWLFGIYAGFVYIKAGRNIIAPILLHSYWNIIQIPHLKTWFDIDVEQAVRTIVSIGYIAGIVGFFSLFSYLP